MNEAIAVAARLRGQPGRVVLLSGRSAEGLGQLSVVAADPDAVISGSSTDVRVTERDGTLSARGADAMKLIETRLAHSPGATAIGYLGYELGAAACAIASWSPMQAREPDVWFGIYSAHWSFDNDRGTSEVRGVDQGARQRLEAAIANGEATLGSPPELETLKAEDGVDEAYHRGFFAVADYLRAGDCYQVNLSRRLTAKVVRRGDPLALFARLCHANPEPYAAMIETGEHTILSGSPERFLYRALASGRIETRPIKGTRARTGDEARDAEARKELIESEKEGAEHLMIVDLERNDLGRISRVGSVRVDELKSIIRLPTLFHMVSTVSGELKESVGLHEILGATFPGGSITGAPKLRSMEVIRELEPTPRGVYTGAIGMLGPGGAIDLSIAIRTAVLCSGSLSLHVGGGLVADSTFERELAETEEKAWGWRRTLG